MIICDRCRTDCSVGKTRTVLDRVGSIKEYTNDLCQPCYANLRQSIEQALKPLENK